MNFVWLYTLESNRHPVESRLYTSFENNRILMPEWAHSDDTRMIQQLFGGDFKGKFLP